MIGFSHNLSLVDLPGARHSVADGVRRNWLWAKSTPLRLTGLLSSLLGLCALGVVESRAHEVEVLDLRSRVVTATAYNSVRSQTDKTPNLTAWGYRLKPGMKVVAVSRDLIKRGLTHGAWVVIDGIPGVFRVLDKMASRWRNRIDIYMGRDIMAAREWGRRKVRIWWEDYSKEGLAKIKKRLELRTPRREERGRGSRRELIVER